MARRYPARQPIPEWTWQSQSPPPHTRVLPPNRYTFGEHHRKEPTVEENEERPHTIDVIGSGPETTICGHIDLLYLLPLRNTMHRKLLEKFKKKPGNYEGKYNNAVASKASVVDYGNGYVAIHFTDDITRPEMSDFLLAHDWRMLNANYTVQDGKNVIYEKWTNVISRKEPDDRKEKMARSYSMPRRYY